MSTQPPTILLSDLLQPFENLTPMAAREVADLKFSPSVQARVSELAQKNNDGTITEEELLEYETVVKYGNVLSVIKAQARKVLAESA